MSGSTSPNDRLDPILPDSASDSLRRTWLACEKAFDQAATDARISA
jgi:hypothetical protein